MLGADLAVGWTHIWWLLTETGCGGMGKATRRRRHESQAVRCQGMAANYMQLGRLQVLAGQHRHLGAIIDRATLMGRDLLRSVQARDLSEQGMLAPGSDHRWSYLDGAGTC